MLYRIAKEFTESPGGRYKKESEFSGEDFRDRILIKLINECISKQDTLIIDLDGTYGYATSFLDEAFGKLVGIFDDAQLSILSFKSDDEPGLIEKIYRYMENNKV